MAAEPAKVTPLRRIPRRRLLALLAAASGAVVTACTSGSHPRPPTPKGMASSPSAPPTAQAQPGTHATATPVAVTTKGISAGLADLAHALYNGKQINTTTATAALQHRQAPRSAKVSVTGSQGTWHGTPVGILSQGRDLTFAIQRGGTWSVVAGWWPDLGVDAVSAGDKQFALVIGSDARESEGEAVTSSRGDSLHIVGVDGSGGAGIVGIPRDSWTSFGKINSALVFHGPDGQVEAIKEISGLPITYYVLTGFDGFSSFVDALGGVTVNSPQAIPSRGIPKGLAHLNSKIALQFARERHALPDGDFGRSADQETLLVGFARAIKAFGPSRFGKLVTTLSKLTDSNLPAENALQYAAWAWSTKPSKVVGKVAVGTNAVRGDQDVVLLGSEAKAIFRDFADGKLSRG